MISIDSTTFLHAKDIGVVAWEILTCVDLAKYTPSLVLCLCTLLATFFQLFVRVKASDSICGKDFIPWVFWFLDLLWVYLKLFDQSPGNNHSHLTISGRSLRLLEFICSCCLPISSICLEIGIHQRSFHRYFSTNILYNLHDILITVHVGLARVCFTLTDEIETPHCLLKCLCLVFCDRKLKAYFHRAANRVSESLSTFILFKSSSAWILCFRTSDTRPHIMDNRVFIFSSKIIYFLLISILFSQCLF